MQTPGSASHIRADDATLRTNTAVVNDYLTAFWSGDFPSARAVVADDFSFSGPFLTSEGKAAFFEGAAGLRQIVRGHRVLRQWADGDDVSSVYEVRIETPAGAGQVLMSEWHTVREGAVSVGRVVFDTAAFRTLVPQTT